MSVVSFEILEEVKHGCVPHGSSDEEMAYARQVHGMGIIDVEPGQGGCLGEADALVISAPGAVRVQHADCQAALFFDPVQRVAAAVHCGWRGNVQNIYQVVVDHLADTHGCRAENLRVGISPSLGPDNSEFVNYRTELPENFWKFQIRPAYFDLWAISRWQLEAAGLLPQHIEIAGICTYAHSEWHSYRRDKVKTPNYSFIRLAQT